MLAEILMQIHVLIKVQGNLFILTIPGKQIGVYRWTGCINYITCKCVYKGSFIIMKRHLIQFTILFWVWCLSTVAASSEQPCINLVQLGLPLSSLHLPSFLLPFSLLLQLLNDIM